MNLQLETLRNGDIFRKFQKILEIKDKWPSKITILTIVLKITKEVLKHFTKTPVLLNCKNLFTIFYPGL